MEMAKKAQSQPKIPPNPIKLQEIVKNEESDRISTLPDCLLIEILSRLPCTKVAIRTGTLSKRWTHLWTLLPSLIFKHNHDTHSWSDFVSLVNETLTQCRQWKLKKFEVFTRYYSGFDWHVNNWVGYAIRCNVEELNLTLWSVESNSYRIHPFFLVSSCFTDLTFKGCIISPIGPISWKNLRSLSITNGKLDEDLIENILSGSPVLETLVLDHCYGFRLLDITSKSVKKLVISGYMNPGDEYDNDNDNDLYIVEINAPNILSLTIHGNLLLWKLLLVNVCCLVEANLDYTKMGHWETTRKEAEEEMLKGFILKLLHVKEIRIGGFCYKALFRLEAKGLNITPNVKFPGETYDWYDGDSVESEDLTIDYDHHSVESEDL